MSLRPQVDRHLAVDVPRVADHEVDEAQARRLLQERWAPGRAPAGRCRRTLRAPRRRRRTSLRAPAARRPSRSPCSRTCVCWCDRWPARPPPRRESPSAARCPRRRAGSARRRSAVRGWRRSREPSSGIASAMPIMICFMRCQSCWRSAARVWAVPAVAPVSTSAIESKTVRLVVIDHSPGFRLRRPAVSMARSLTAAVDSVGRDSRTGLAGY